MRNNWIVIVLILQGLTSMLIMGAADKHTEALNNHSSAIFLLIGKVVKLQSDQHHHEIDSTPEYRSNIGFLPNTKYGSPKIVVHF